jgi:hypothetical protein
MILPLPVNEENNKTHTYDVYDVTCDVTTKTPKKNLVKFFHRFFFLCTKTLYTTPNCVFKKTEV